jgi:hypothetical protein
MGANRESPRASRDESLCRTWTRDFAEPETFGGAVKVVLVDLERLYGSA